MTDTMVGTSTPPAEPPPTTVPWAWQDKRVLRRIRQAFDSQNAVASALAVYHALTEIASDDSADQFTTTIPHIAHLAGLCSRTTAERVRDLAKLGALAVHTPKLKAPSTYKLLPFDKASPTLGNGCRTIRNGCLAIGKQEALSFAYSRRTRRTEEEPIYRHPTLEQVKARAAKINLPAQEAERFFNYYTANGWKVGRNPMKSWPHALANWKVRGIGQHQKPTAPAPDHSKGF